MPTIRWPVQPRRFHPATVCATLQEAFGRIGAHETMSRAALLLWFVLGMTLARPLAAADKVIPGERLFTGGKVPTFKITVEGPALAVLEKNDRSYVRATVTEGTNVFKDVGIHLKGAAGSFRPLDADKPAFTLNFDKFVDDQNFHGLDTRAR